MSNGTRGGVVTGLDLVRVNSWEARFAPFLYPCSRPSFLHLGVDLVKMVEIRVTQL